MKKRVVIIGCGFAGVFASRQFLRFKKFVEVTAIDKKESFDFLPMLPDAVGRNISPEFLAYPIKLLSRRFGFNFINEEVKSVDVRENSVLTAQRTLNYDYLIIASGSETNFYGNNEIKKYAYKVDDVRDVKMIFEALEKESFDCLLISGGGYTGIEIATNLRAHLNRKRLQKRIIIIERAPSILGPLPEWVKAYVYENLKELDIEVLTNTVINKAKERSVFLSCAEVFDNAMLIWTAGVRTADFVQNLNAEKNPQGRVRVDEYLRIKNDCFVVGDCAYVPHTNDFLRMAVQFAIYQAISAACSIMRSIKGKRLVKYSPFDLGYIIPMANNNSCGSVLGLKVIGCPATMMHFTMCAYRSFGLKNKLGIIKGLIRGGGGWRTRQS